VITSLGLAVGRTRRIDRGVHRITQPENREIDGDPADGPDNYRILDEIRTHYGALP